MIEFIKRKRDKDRFVHDFVKVVKVAVSCVTAYGFRGRIPGTVLK